MTGYLRATLAFFKRFLGAVTSPGTIDEGCRIKDCPAEFAGFSIWSPF
jgi:hypothetical protein